MRLGDYAAAKLRQSDHVLADGTLVSSTYEPEYGKGKKAATLSTRSGKFAPTQSAS